MTKQNEPKKELFDFCAYLTEDRNLDDFLLDEEWDDDGEDRACLDSCHIDDDLDGWMGTY